VRVQTLTKETPIRDVLTMHAGAAEVFERHGLGCAVCLGAEFETLASVAAMHDISVDALIDDLNRLGPTPEGA
jgi:hybrid cluster-associated redox disulfide protein